MYLSILFEGEGDKKEVLIFVIYAPALDNKRQTQSLYYL